MGNLEILIVSLVVLFVLLGSGSHIFIAMGLTGLLTLWIIGGNQSIIALLTWGTSCSFLLIAVPLFIFMGNLMFESGMSADLYTGTSVWLGRLPGGLIHSNIGACAIFAAISGSSVATAATIGSVAIPELQKRGYHRGLTLGSVCAGGTLGILIPPSINMIVYGAWMEVSVSQLFIAGIIPGVILAMAFMLYVAILAIKRPHLFPARDEKPTARLRLQSLGQLAPVGSLIVVITGGIYSGIMTPTETAAVASGLAFIFIALKRRLRWHIVMSSALKSVNSTCMIMAILISATIFGHALLRLGFTGALKDLISGGEMPKWMILAAIYIMYLILGCFFDGLSMLLLTLPFVEPIVAQIGVSPIWFGVMVIILTEIGMVTPPVGMNLYVVLGIAEGGTMSEVVKGAIPFLIILFVGIILFTLFPDIILWLPSTMAS